MRDLSGYPGDVQRKIIAAASGGPTVMLHNGKRPPGFDPGPQRGLCFEHVFLGDYEDGPDG